MSIELKKKMVQFCYLGQYLSSDFVSSVSCIRDTKKIPKDTK